MTRKGVTLQLLHEEYKKDNPDGYERRGFMTSIRNGQRRWTLS
jgi:hypothetical protein